MNTKFLFQKSALALAMGSCLTVVSPITQAVVLKADADYSLPRVAVSGSMSDGPSATNVNANIGGPSFLYYPDNASATGQGNDSGWMYSGANGSGFYTAGGHIQQRHEMTNAGTAAMAYNFNFTISQGSLRATDSRGYLGAEYALAAYDVTIKLNNSVIWQSAATLRNDIAGSSLAQSGTPLAAYTPTSDNYAWTPYSDTLSLGIFNPGDRFILEYDIFTKALGDTGYAGDCGDIPGNLSGLCAKGWSSTQFGDPNGFSSMPINNSTVMAAPVSVPEPSALLLMAGGAAGLVYARRRKSRPQ